MNMEQVNHRRSRDQLVGLKKCQLPLRVKSQQKYGSASQAPPTERMRTAPYLTKERQRGPARAGIRPIIWGTWLTFCSKTNAQPATALCYRSYRTKIHVSFLCKFQLNTNNCSWKRRADHNAIWRQFFKVQLLFRRMKVQSHNGLIGVEVRCTVVNLMEDLCRSCFIWFYFAKLQTAIGKLQSNLTFPIE